MLNKLLNNPKTVKIEEFINSSISTQIKALEEVRQNEMYLNEFPEWLTIFYKAVEREDVYSIMALEDQCDINLVSLFYHILDEQN